ncbi:hypothetical protein SDC9_26202 [bioreactor metagenome]|uniref:VCBS repeat-containing protein n=1 Tax=bioreactor metagenome TaxID=1076179 RepID=A0A644UNN3_9ZZZZ|nr:hypothetical protein [Desulfitobacterium hafniense]MEA5023717.1 hypothetical protein [Desulfitobacterium hafniense]
MKIQSSAIVMAGESKHTESYKKEVTLQSWQNKDAAGKPVLNLENADILDLSDSIKDRKSPAANVQQAQEISLEISEGDKRKLELLQLMLEAITGKKLRFFVPQKLVLNDSNRLPFSPTQAPTQGWGIVFESREQYIEQQSMSFSAQGQVTTADGKTIDLQLQLNISRSFAYQNNISFRAGDAVTIDPLAINLGVSSAQLTQQKYVFDLDYDGNTELISFLAPGSGFIALDKNGDGIINDGSELFGTRSGDGFADLALYDSDHNGWIDENDPIYDKLRIWTKNEKGEDVLFALGEQGIGALYLGSAATDFSLKDDRNQSLGEIRRTGIYLNENGTVGTLQHVDLTI